MPEVSDKGDRLLVGGGGTVQNLVYKQQICGRARAGISCCQAETGLGKRVTAGSCTRCQSTAV